AVVEAGAALVFGWDLVVFVLDRIVGCMISDLYLGTSRRTRPLPSRRCRPCRLIPARLHSRSLRISEFRPLFRGLLRQCFDYVNVWQHLRWQVMPLLQIGQAVVSDPNFPLSIFPDQNLERKVDRATGRRQHHRSACLWIPENQQLRGTHFYSCFYRCSAVVDQREQGNSLLLENPLELLDRFVHRVAAPYVDKPAAFLCRHNYLRLFTNCGRLQLYYLNRLL